MKLRRVALLILVLWAISVPLQSASSQDANHPQKWAIVVGACHVAGRPDLQLKYSEKDIDSLMNLGSNARMSQVLPLVQQKVSKEVERDYGRKQNPVFINSTEKQEPLILAS